VTASARPEPDSRPPGSADVPAGAAPVDPAGLPPFLRVLLAVDGTVTEVLEAWFGEPVAVEKLRMAVEAGRAADRAVVLKGARTGRRFAHAVSALDLDALPAAMRQGLSKGTRGIGQLMRDERLETYRELGPVWAEPAGALAPALHCAPENTLIGRRYAIWMAGRPAIRIVERFPLALYAG